MCKGGYDQACYATRTLRSSWTISANILSELDEVRRMELTGASFLRRLEALRERHRLNPPEPDESGSAAAATEVTRIICSDGLAAP